MIAKHALFLTLLWLVGAAPEGEEVPIRVPPGFTVERVTTPDLVKRPVMACFDDRGRLYVSESAGLNLRADDLLKQLPDRIVRLEDTDGDGKFDKSVVFADQMSFPQGVLWHGGVVYSCSPPSVWKLEDTDGDGVCDRRSELVSKFGFTGNAADIHGPVLAPSGWLYWNDGRHGHTIRREDGTAMAGKAARIFRCRPDGSGVEAVCGGGMDNPVETAFTAEGEALSTVAILYGSPRRIDAIIHAIEGGAFPYHEVVNEFKRTGELLGPVADLGWVAPSGLMRYRSEAFGKEHRNAFFSALFNTHKVLRNGIERDGATFRSRDEEFVVSTSEDFHPTDVLEDADGSLLVVDTGGWFRIGCPTSRIAKPEILGAIYRVRRKDAPKVEDPRGLSIAWDTLGPGRLAALLDDPRFAVRDRAIATLARREAVEAVAPAARSHSSVRVRRNAVWTLTRIEGAAAREAVRAALGDADLSVRLAAAHSAGLHRDAAALEPLLKLVRNDPEPAARREAATALGRIGSAKAVPALFDGLRAGGDRFLEHALIYALIQIKDREGTLPGLEDPSPRVRRGALIALDQMDGGNLTREKVTPLLDPADPALQQAALGVITSRPAWAKEVMGLVAEWLGAPELDEAREGNLRGVLLAFAKDAAVQDLVARTLRRPSLPAGTRLLLLEVMARAPLDRLPATWVAEARWSLEQADEKVARQAVATLRAAGAKEFDDALLRLAHDEARSADLRAAALGTAAPRLAKLEASLFSFLITCVHKEKPPLLRLAAAEALGRAPLDDGKLNILARHAAEAGALELPKLLPAFERSRNADVGKRLLAALEKSPGFANLMPETVRAAIKNFPEDVRKAAQPLLKRLDVDLEQQQARLAELQPAMAGGDAARGRTVFFGQRAGCAACHTVQGQGGRVGPDLSTIGAIRTPRDLLEAIVLPSASFVRGYEPYVVRTSGGDVLSGIIARETTDAVYLYSAERTELRVPRSSIEVLQQSRVSIMPQGLEAQLSRPELADLIAFLAALK